MSHMGSPFPSPPIPGVSTHRLGFVGFNAIYQLQPLQLGVLEASSWGRQEGRGAQISFLGRAMGSPPSVSPQHSLKRGCRPSWDTSRSLALLMDSGEGPGRERRYCFWALSATRRRLRSSRELSWSVSSRHSSSSTRLWGTRPRTPPASAAQGTLCHLPSTHPAFTRAELTAPGSSALFSQHSPHRVYHSPQHHILPITPQCEGPPQAQNLQHWPRRTPQWPRSPPSPAGISWAPARTSGRPRKRWRSNT